MTGLGAVDATLQGLLSLGIPRVSGTGQIGFRPPDSSWRSDVNALTSKEAFNVYLLELRENRRLRTSEPVEEIVNGISYREPAPVRVDCHYLVTAWSGAEESVGRTRLEHELLGEALAVLMNARPLSPRRVFRFVGYPQGFPPELEDAEFPSTVAPPDGYPKLPEFWGTLRGDVNPWKPAIHLVVTAPVTVERELDGVLVTTRIATYRVEGDPGDAPDPGETLIQIGGEVRESAAPRPLVAGAAMELRTHPAGERIRTSPTDVNGRFSFQGLSAGRYRITARADGHAPVTTPPFDVPSATGAYDLSV